MANQEFAGFLFNNAGTAISGATVNLYDRNDTDTSRADTTTDSNGYWAISHGTEGRFDVEITSGSSVRRIMYDKAAQYTTLEVANFRLRNPADTFNYDIVPAAIVADRTLTLPLITGSDTLASLGLAQTFSAAQTFTNTITVGVDGTGKDVKLFGDTAGSFLLWDESEDALELTDSSPIKIGDGADMQIYHDGSHSYVTNATGTLKLATETSGIAVTIGHTTSEVTVADNLTVTGTLTLGSGAELTEAELEFLDGITAGTAAASKALVLDSSKDIATIRNLTIDGVFTDGNYTFDTSGNVSGLGTVASGAITSSGIIKTDDATEATSTTDGSLQTDGGLSVVKDAVFGDDIFLLSDGAVFNMGAGNDFTITHDGTTGATLAGNPINITGTSNAVGALYLRANGGTSETLKIHSDHGTSVTEGAESVTILSDAGGVGIRSTANLANAVNITVDGGTTSSMTLFNDQGTSVTEGAESIAIISDAGGIGIRSTANLANAVNITVDGGTTSSMTLFNDQGTGATEGSASIQLLSHDGGINIKSGLNGANAILLTADGGSSETIVIHSDQGTGTASVKLLSDAGGITLQGTGVILGDIVYINDTANGKMTTGLTINQGTAVNEILTFKGSGDINHGVTGITETDTYAFFRKSEGGTLGGLEIGAFSEGTEAFMFFAVSPTDNTTKTTSARAAVTFKVYDTDGTSVQSKGSNANLMTIGDGSSMRFIFDVEGDLWLDAGGGAGTADPTSAHSEAILGLNIYDAYDDAQLVRTLDHARSSHGAKGMIQEKWDDYIKYSEDTLIELGILGDTLENGGLLSMTGLQRLHNGAIWQGYQRQCEMQDRIEALETKLLALTAGGN